jgi:hypothetical protein
MVEVISMLGWTFIFLVALAIVTCWVGENL